MRIDILMVISVREASKLSGKPSTTFITLSRPAKTITPPVLERTEDAEKCLVRCCYGPAFAKRYVVSGIEGECGNVSEGAGVFPSISGTQNVAVVFDEPEVVFCA